MLQRLLYPWNLPPYGMTNTDTFDWNPDKQCQEAMLLPDPIKEMVSQVQWEWMFDFSCAVARQLRQVGVSLEERDPANGAVFIANDQCQVSPVASAHAYLMTLAQRSAIEMVNLMREPVTLEIPAPRHQEITGVAFFAECAGKRGTGNRLSETLHLLAQEVTSRCIANHNGNARVQFSHSRPTQARSPIVGRGTLPVSGYRIRFEGCDSDQMLQTLADSVQALPPPHRIDDKADIMVLSNLWCTASV